MKIMKSIRLISNSPVNLAYIFGTLVLYITSWQLELKPAFRSYNKYQELSTFFSTITSSEKDKISGKPNNNVISVSNIIEFSSNESKRLLLDIITQCCNKYSVSIIDIPQEYEYEQDGFSVTVNQFKFEGDYFSLLNLLYFLDTSQIPSRPISMRMFRYQLLTASKPTIRVILFYKHLQLLK